MRRGFRRRVGYRRPAMSGDRHELRTADAARLCSDAAARLRAGEPCVLPTETSYVVAALPNHAGALAALRQAARLPADAIQATPALRVPIVARLVGRGAAEARRVLADRMPGLIVEEDLDAALAHVAGYTK